MAKVTRSYRTLFALVCLLCLSNISAESQASRSTTSPPALPNSFVLASPSPSTLTLMQGQAGMATLALSSGNSFRGEIKLGCTGAATGLQCLVSPQVITLQPGESRDATVAIATQGSSTYNLRSHAAAAPLSNDLALAASAAWLGCLLCLRRRKIATLCLLFVMSFVGALSILGCAERRTDTRAATPSGQTVVQITASSGSIMQTQTLMITVEQP